jgi:hypothetical protein
VKVELNKALTASGRRNFETRQSCVRACVHIERIRWIYTTGVGAADGQPGIRSATNASPASVQQKQFLGHFKKRLEGYIQSGYIAGRRRYIRPTKWQRPQQSPAVHGKYIIRRLPA